MQIYINGKFAAYKELLDELTVEKVEDKEKSLKEIYIDYLNKLDEPYRTKAIYNINDSFIEKQGKPISVADALLRAFLWGSSPEEDNYWRKVHVKL